MDTAKKQKGLKEVNMGFYQMEVTHDPALTFEERIEEIRKIGKKATTDFAEKYSALHKWFAEHDALYLLSFCKNYFICSEEGYDEEAEKGYLEFPPYLLEILQAFALVQPRSFSGKPLLDEIYPFKDALKEIGKLSLLKMYALPESVINMEEVNAHRIRTEMMAHTTAVRNWAYYHQMTKVTKELASTIKDDFKKVHGFCPVAFLNLLDKLIEEVETKLNTHSSKVRQTLLQKTYTELMDEYEKQFPHVSVASPEQKENIWEQSGKNIENLRAMFLAHSDLYLDKLFSFHVDEILHVAGNGFDRSQLAGLFTSLSYSFGDLKEMNQEHIILNNPVHQKPFIKIGDEEFYTSLWGIIPHLSIALIENLVSENDKLKDVYNKNKAAYLEDQLYELIIKSFPSATVYKSGQWQSDDGKKYENDLLVLLHSFVLVIEAKSGTVTYSAKRGAPERLAKTLKQLIEEPSDQALRFIEHLKGHAAVTLESDNAGKISIDTTGMKYFIPLGVTLSHLGIISTNLKLIIEAGLTEKKIHQLAPSVSLTDLQLVFDFLPLEASKLHYLQRRREFELYVDYAADEMDLLAFYLDTGFNVGKTESSKEWRFNLVLKSKELDPFIINTERGIATKKPESDLTQWWKDMLNRLAELKPPTWLETSYILLNFMEEEQKELEKSLKIIVTDIKAGKMEYKHNWVIGATANEQRKFIIIAYPYLSKYREERDAMMEDIINSNYNENIKGILVIAINIEKAHYPYSVFCSVLSPKLFESNFIEMTKTNI